MAPNNVPRRGRESSVRRVVRRLRDRSEISPFYKYILFFTNLLFWIAGLGCLIIGAYILALKEKKVTYFVEFLFDPSCLLTLAGCIIVFISFFGMAGALREFVLFIRIYYWLVSIFLLLQIIGIIFIFIFYFMEDVAKQLHLYPEDVLNDAIIKYRDPDVDDKDIRNTIDDLQDFFGCCGVSNTDDGYKDWNRNKYFNCTPFNNGEKSTDPVGEQCSVPISCCIIPDGGVINYQCGYWALKDGQSISGRINTRGCLYAIKVTIEGNAWVIGGIIIGVLIPQAILVCMAKTLYDQILMQLSKW